MPTDGFVLSGSSFVDEAMITGEDDDDTSNSDDNNDGGSCWLWCQK